MFGHDGFMGSNATIGVGACFSSKKPTIIFIGDAALEEDYVLASLSWISKKIYQFFLLWKIMIMPY